LSGLLILHDERRDDLHNLFLLATRELRDILEDFPQLTRRLATTLRHHLALAVDILPCEIVGKWVSRNHFYFLYRALTDPFTLKELLGHSKIETTEGYVTPSMAEMKAAAEGLAQTPAKVLPITAARA
jgi:hypothetical protein